MDSLAVQALSDELPILVAFRGRSVLKMCSGRREWFANGSRS